VVKRSRAYGCSLVCPVAPQHPTCTDHRLSSIASVPCPPLLDCKLLSIKEPASLVLIGDDFRYLTNCMLLFELCLVVTRLCPAPFHRPGGVGRTGFGPKARLVSRRGRLFRARVCLRFSSWAPSSLYSGLVNDTRNATRRSSKMLHCASCSTHWHRLETFQTSS
jgi:hypothetical protein